MQSVLTRPQVLGSAPPSSHHVPRKSSSFLSLRREKDKPTAPLDLYSIPADSSGPSCSLRPAYFDAYPRPKTSPNGRPSKLKGTRPSSSKNSPSAENPAASRQDLWEKQSSGIASTPEPSYAFPTIDAGEDFITPGNAQLTPKQYSRTRSRTGPSTKSKWHGSSTIPHLRFSGSSTQHTETPPRTPVDVNVSKESLENFPVVVAAPISGVETMDALVDGMNGGDDIIGRSTSLSNRARFGIPGHHPLYQPPLPTPPPGVVLGGGKVRRAKPRSPSPSSNSDDGDEHNVHVPISTSRQRRRRAIRPQTPRTASNSTITPSPSQSFPTPERTNTPPPASRPELALRKPMIQQSSEKRRSVIPSISEIIRSHAPPKVSQGHATLHEEMESEPEPLTLEEEAELVSRSSIDSVADEIQRTLRNQAMVKPPPTAPPSAFPKRHSVISDSASIYSPRSDPGAGSSIYSSSAASVHQPSSPLDTSSFLAMMRPSPSQAVAQYLRSARLTTLLKLTRSPHASQDNPLTVSLSDLGSPTGFPVVVFLGLDVSGMLWIGSWGLGRTEPRSKSAKGIMQWASVVEEVLDLLHIGECSVMAHSAGAPYALSFANKVPGRIRGDICLLAPWVGGSENGGGYKWLKYVPNGILKTAQAAEWKLQAWMIGKPPTIAYEGIGYNASPAAAVKPPTRSTSSPHSNGSLNIVYPSHSDGRPRPSIGSFSEYDDLGDFDGRFESRSTLGAGSRPPSQYSHAGSESKIFVNKRKVSRGFLERLKGSSHSQPQSPTEDKPQTGKRLKALRSMGSLKGKASTVSRKFESPTPPQTPPSLKIELGIGLDDVKWSKTVSPDGVLLKRDAPIAEKFSTAPGPYTRASGRRSISFSAPKPLLSMPSSPSPSTSGSTFAPSIGPGSAYQAALGNALIAASHSESAKGTHNDLLQILNHENHPWGFSYTSYPHNVHVWYGDKDEKIAENAVRWMERNMGENGCVVKVVRGADHGLMYRSGVVIEVLEKIMGYWKSGKPYHSPDNLYS
ncbi:hypothetical protein BD779DRAFT_1666355 [Infundibulicybe gibba]|nr:hypothetical protein BD779DRAFT_1666355 [Infundibulicybe gibba]